MRLRVLLPSRVLLDARADKVVAEGANGSFGLLPAHVDFVTALVPGILSYQSSNGGEERHLGVDEGILVKHRSLVLVSVRNAVQADELGAIRQAVDERFLVQDERDRMVRSSMARLEAGFARKFLEFQKHG